MPNNILKIIRKEKGLTQQQIADLIGVSKQYISFVETYRNELSPKQVETIEQALNVKFSDYENLQEASNWQAKLNLTDSEMELFTVALEKDKEIFLLLAKALNGDSTALERLKKLLF